MEGKSSGSPPYLYVFIFSLLMAAILRSAIEYLDFQGGTKQTFLP